MLKMFSASTNELDDAKVAVKEILEQLNLSENQRKNSAAIITAYQDTDDEVIKAVAKSLPFESIGITTFMSATDKQSDYMQIIVSVFTSDDVEFAIGCSDNIVKGSDSEIVEALKETIAKIKNPQAIFGCAPFLSYANVDYYTRIMNQINPKILFFSSVSVDNTADFHLNRTIFNGEKFEKRAAFIVLGGEKAKLNFDFAIATVSPEKAFRSQEDAVVTKSAPGLLIEINNEPASKYLNSLGFEQDDNGKFTTINANPIMVDFNDGTQEAVRGMLGFTPDDSFIIGGDIPVGTKIAVSQFEISDIVKTTTQTLTEFVEKNKNASGFILYSCCGRYFNLGFQHGMKEIETVQKIINAAKKPFLFSYVCGEMCPMYKNENELVNRGHNYTCIMAAIY